MGREEDERGAGGKVKKPFSRNSTNSTPYARRPTQDQQKHHVVVGGGSGGWWNRISGGATRFIPYFFSKPLICNAGETDTGEAEQDVSDEGPESSPIITRSKEDGQVPLKAEVSSMYTCTDANADNTLRRSSDFTGISEIEMMLKGKTLSRNDLSRLTEILRSKVAVQSDVDECEKRKLDVPKVQAVFTSLDHENFKGPDNEKEAMYLKRVVGESSSPFPVSALRDLAGASPIEIAKAYMGTRASESGVGSQSVFGKERINTVPASDFLPKSSVPSPAQNSSICWPGAMIEQSHSYLTPKTERRKVVFSKNLQTPYSRPVHLRTTSKMEGGSDRSRDILSTNLKQFQTPVYAASQVTRTGIHSQDDGFGSVGPIRRTHRKFQGTMTPKGLSSSRSAISGASWKESFDASKHHLPMGNESLEPGTSTSSNTYLQSVVKEPNSVGFATVHSHSSDVARKILEHLDRTIPTPEKKAVELKLATIWRNLPLSESTNSIMKAPSGILRVENSETQVGQKFPNQEKELACLLNSQLNQSKSGEATNPVNTKSLGSGVLSCGIFHGGTSFQFNTKPSVELEKIPEREVNRNEVSIRQDQTEMNHPIPKQGEVSGQAFSMFPHSDAGSKTSNAPMKLSTHSFGNKPTLTSISITKPDLPSRISFDNGSGFTFPIYASSASLFEPPTPSISPSFSAKGLPLLKENNIVSANKCCMEKDDPSYNFGSHTADRAIVFSFASSGLSTPADFSVPKFTFGSSKARVSFRSVGKHALCS